MTDIYPNEGSAAYKFLTDLLNGHQVTVIDALLNYNLMTPNARASELRKMGWPIKSLKVPHPSLVDELIVAYYMEAPFRQWWIDQGQRGDPKDYPYEEGRGKFTQGTLQ